MSARYGVMKRDCTDTDEIKWFDLPNHYVFHFVNAWDSKNEKGEDIVTMFGCAMSDVNLDFKHKENPNDPTEQEHPFLWESNDSESRGLLTKFTFNLTTGEHEMKTLLENIASDFPIIDMDQMGYENRYAYLTYFADEIPEEQNGVYS
jgi:carotenoid cleavage dioxygenase-like enzyme